MNQAAHLLFCRLVAAAAASWAALLLLWPGLSRWMPSGALPPLHARCVAVLHLALACGLWSAIKRLDEAAARLPLLLLSIWGAAAVVAGLAAPQPLTGKAWMACALLAATRASWLLVRDAGVAAPAERLDLRWAALGLGVGMLSAALLLLPELAAALWPWRMKASQTTSYGSALLGFGAMAWAAARERRGYAREPAMQAWLALSAGLLGVSMLHLDAFAAQRPATWIWFGLLAGIASWAAAHQGWLRRARACRPKHWD